MFDVAEFPNWLRMCDLCGFVYEIDEPKQVHEHEEHHQRFLRALDEGWPLFHINAVETLIAEGMKLAETGATFEERVKGAERWFRAKWFERQAGAILYDAPLITFEEFFRERVAYDYRGCFDKEITAELVKRFGASPENAETPQQQP